jgi:hypothetical protein
MKIGENVQAADEIFHLCAVQGQQAMELISGICKQHLTRIGNTLYIFTPKQEHSIFQTQPVQTAAANQIVRMTWYQFVSADWL